MNAPSVDVGRLGGLFLRLHRERWSGLVYATSGTRHAAFAFRDGIPVLIEDSGAESTIADQFMSQGLITRDEYADVIARVTEDLVENEDVAFCEHAVRLGFLTSEQVQSALSERVRAKLIQALALSDCRLEFDDSRDALAGIAEYPQRLGSIVYIGVRTFYEEGVLRGFLPDLRSHYLRLTKPPVEIARFFELDYEEIALLNSIDPLRPAATWFDDCDLDPSHALSLVGLLYIGQMCEFSAQPFVASEERSGVRQASGPEPTRAASRQAMPALRPESQTLRNGARPPNVHQTETQRPGSTTALPAIQTAETPLRPLSRTALPAAREENYESKSGSRAGASPREQEHDRRDGSRAGALPRDDDRGARAGMRAGGHQPDPKHGSRAGALPSEESFEDLNDAPSGSRAGALPSEESFEDLNPESNAGASGRDDVQSARGPARAGAAPRRDDAGSRADALPRRAETGSRADALPREGAPGSRAGALPRESDPRRGSRAGALPREEDYGSRAGALPREEDYSSRAGALPRESDPRRGSRAGALPREEDYGARAGAVPRESDPRRGSRAGALPREEDYGSRAGALPREEDLGSRAAREADPRRGSRAGALPREDDHDSRAGALPGEADRRPGSRAGASPAHAASAARAGREPAARQLTDRGLFGAGEAKHVAPGTLLGVRSSNEVDDSEPPTSGDSGDAAAEALAEARARVVGDTRRGGAYAAQRLPREPSEPQSVGEGDPQREQRNFTAPHHAPRPNPSPGAVIVQPGKPTPGPRPATRPNEPRGSNPREPAASGGDPQAPRAGEPKRAQTPVKVDDPFAKPIAGAAAAGQGQLPEYQRAHLKELMQRRHGAAPEPQVAKRDPVRELRSAQESLREGQYARAEEQLRVLSELAPNDTVRTYWMWAQLRAGQGFDAGQLAGLRDLAKKLVSEPEHAGFACYVLGHLYLSDKKDDQAEKYFRKAHALDKSNKDAERHVVILERRKHQAADADTPGQRKIFGISLNKPKGS